MTDESATRPLPDLTACDRELIHVPGHIQPHGVLIATHPGSDRISHVSANIEAALGVTAARALSGTLGDLLGESAMTTLRKALSSGAHTPSNLIPLDLQCGGVERLNVRTHRHLGRTIVEFDLDDGRNEPAPSMQSVQTLMGRLS